MTEQTTNTAELDLEAQIVDPQAVADLMAALERVFKIGVYYPAGHSMCDQAADQFLQTLARTLGKAPSMRFSASSKGLALQGLVLENDLRGVKDFLELLTGLGIAAVDMDSNVDAADLHDFVTRLLAYRNHIKGARDFQQVIVEDMPSTIHIEHLEFTARDIEDADDDEDSGDISQPSIENFLATLAKRGLDAQQISRCRKLLKAIPGYLRTQDLDSAALPQVTWSDVEKLLVKAVQVKAPTPGKENEERSGSHVNLDALTAIFKSLGKHQEDASSREAIDLLLTHLHRAAPAHMEASGEAKKKQVPAKDLDLMPKSELRAAIKDCGEQATEPPRLMTEGRAEEISILMQMLGGDQKLKVQVRIQKQIRDIARSPLTPDEWAIAVAGTRQLLDPEHADRVLGPMVILTEALRTSEHASVLVFLRDVARDCSPEQNGLLWPFLVNEALVEGRLKEPEAFAEVCALAALPDEETMKDQLPRLETLSVLRDKRCARDVFSPPPLTLCKVLALVLNSSHAAFIGERLLGGLRREPLGWLSEAVVPLLGQFQAKHRRFLTEVLLQADKERISKSLTDNAGRIIVEALPALSGGERKESWVPTTVRALARLSVPGRQRVLTDIAHTRKYVFFHEWPGAPREAAREVLSGLDGRHESAMDADNE